MIEKRNDCDFCHPDEKLNNKIVNRGDGFISFFSNPRFRRNHILVIPEKHYTKPRDLGASLLGRIAYEAASIADVIDFGYGTIISQKTQPLQNENGIKMDHIHFHVWPRTKQDEQNRIVFPAPRSFDDFEIPHTDSEKEEMERDIQRNKAEFEMLFLRKKGMPWIDIWQTLDEKNNLY